MALRPRSAALLAALLAMVTVGLYLAFWPAHTPEPPDVPDAAGTARLPPRHQPPSNDPAPLGAQPSPSAHRQMPPPLPSPAAAPQPSVEAGVPQPPATLPDPVSLWQSFTHRLEELNGSALEDCRRKQRGRVTQYGEVTGITPMHRFWLNTDLTRFKPCGIGPAQEPVLLDVGGDAYWIRLLSNKRMGCRRNRLVLWEPNPHALKELAAKREELAPHFRKVVLVDQAVSNVSAVAPFYFNGPAGPSGAGALAEGALAAQHHPDHPHVSVRVTTVDATLESLAVEYVPLLKVAARGFEFHVLQGAVHTLARTHTVWFECNHHLQVHLGTVVQFLSERGFLTFKAAHGGLLKLYPPYWEDFYHRHAGDHHCLAIRRGSPLLPNVGVACNNK